MVHIVPDHRELVPQTPLDFVDAPGKFRQPITSSLVPFGCCHGLPPEETICNPASVTSNDPVLSRINPSAVKTRPSAIRGRNIQYFRRIAAIARSCSARSVRKRALPSNVPPPMDSLIFGVFWTLRTHWRFTFAVRCRAYRHPERTKS